jgi:hypothetical protein
LLLIFLAYWLVVFLFILGIFVFFRYLLGAVRRNFRSARAIWIAICLVHLAAILAFNYYHPDIPGSPDEPRVGENFMGLSIFPTLIYCFPSSVLSFALGAFIDNLLCPIAGPQACDSTSAYLAIWWLLPVALGYLQWFTLIPWLLKKSEKRLPAWAIS